MKTLQESIIGRKGVPQSNRIELPNPKKTDLKHLDVLVCRNEEVYICLDQRGCSRNLTKYLEGWEKYFEAYEYDPGRDTIYSLGLENYDTKLKCRNNRPYDIIHVYRGVLDDVKDCDLPVIWDTLEKRIENIQ